MRMATVRICGLAFLIAMGLACGDEDSPTIPPDPPDDGGEVIDLGPFNTSHMPIRIPEAWHTSNNLALDPDGNILLGQLDLMLYSISRETGEMTTVAAVNGTGQYLRSVVYDEANHLIYAANDLLPATIYRITPENGVNSPFVDLPLGRAYQMLIAPESFGEHAGKLLVLVIGLSAVKGGVYALNPRAPIDPVYTFDIDGYDMEFAPDGTLYIADPRNDQIAILEPDGTVVPFLEELVNPLALAIDPGGEFMHVVRTTAELYRITIPDADATLLDTLDRASSGIIVDGHGKLMLMTGTAQGGIFLDFMEIEGPPTR